MTITSCNKCGGSDFFVEVNGNNTGLYCQCCGKWQKWLTKDEARLYEHGLINKKPISLYDKLMERINQSAIKVSTVKAPHTYLKAVGTKELERILKEELG